MIIGKNTKVSVRNILRNKVFSIYISDGKLESRLYKGILKFNNT